MGPERGTDRVEEKSLKGEAHGRSGAQAPGGPVVDVAQGVFKPRTRHAVVEGSAADERVRWLVCVVGQPKSKRGSVVCHAGQPARRHGVPVMCSEEERKSMEGRPQASACRTARQLNARRAV